MLLSFSNFNFFDNLGFCGVFLNEYKQINYCQCERLDLLIWQVNIDLLSWSIFA